MEILKKILELDKELFLHLNSFHSEFLDTIMLMVTRKETWIPLYLVMIFYFIRNYRSKSFQIIFFMILTVILSDQVSVMLKESIQRLRPVYEPAIEHMVHNIFRKGGQYGFVSSHAANSFAIFIFSSKIFKRRSYYYLLFAWACLVAYTRIYAGVHYPLDIIGGALLGWLIAALMFRLLMFVENHFFIARPPKMKDTSLTSLQAGTFYLVFIIMLTMVLIMTYILHHYNYL